MALCAVLASASAVAQSVDREAEAAYERGLGAMRSDRYGDAALAFEDSYRRAAEPRVLYNLALAYRGAGRRIAAIEAFTRYLRDEGAGVVLERRAAVERAIGELRVGLGTLECRVFPESATVTLDGRPVARGTAVPIDPGEHVVTARAEGYRIHRGALRVVEAQRVVFDATLVREVLLAVPRVERAPAGAALYSRWWFWTLIGVAVAGGVTAAVVAATSGARDPTLDTLFNVEALRVW